MRKSLWFIILVVAIAGVAFARQPPAAHAANLTSQDACGYWVTYAQNTDATWSFVHATVTLQKKSACNVWQVATSVWVASGQPTYGISAYIDVADNAQGINESEQSGYWQQGPGFNVYYSPEPWGNCAKAHAEVYWLSNGERLSEPIIWSYTCA